MLWGLFALLTGAAVFAILWPLAKTPRGSAETAAPDVAFYKAKIAEVVREAEGGVLSPQEAEAARTEAARRLLQAVDGVSAQDTVQAPASAQFRLRLVAILGLICVPAVSLGLYSVIGHPSLPDDPLAARLNVAPNRMTLGAAIAKVEAHLLRHPDDGRGYEVLVPAYLGVGRVEDAVRAAAMSMQKLGATPQRETMYGETLVYAANGVVTEDARKLFAAAAAGTPPPLKALYFLGLAASQDGDKATAKTYWQKLLALLPKASPERAELEAGIAALDRKIPPRAAEAAAIAGMSPAARQAAIHTMVDRLAARLAQKGQDVDGWLRLVRAYKVMNETDKAHAALATARHDLSGNAAAMTRIDALARELGLES
ncbi:MAG TPA: c-type cytochrome biogenesis protein CcmI [Methylovirgula sp.]